MKDGRYENLEEMIEKEHKLSNDIVNQGAFGDAEKLLWWQGRLDAWKWCKEQLKEDARK